MSPAHWNQLGVFHEEAVIEAKIDMVWLLR